MPLHLQKTIGRQALEGFPDRRPAHRQPFADFGLDQTLTRHVTAMPDQRVKLGTVGIARPDTEIRISPEGEILLKRTLTIGPSRRYATKARVPHGVNVPDGFATTAAAYQRFLGDTGLAGRIADQLRGLDTDDVRALSAAGREIRRAVVEQPFPPALEADIRAAYEQLAGDDSEASFAVRSSATAEDLPDASFAGQQETFLNVRGIDAILTAIREVFASLYNDRAIAYRVHHAFEHDAVALSAGVQRMVRSDIGASGVMFTMDTESGFTDAIFITSSYGLGEAVVQVWDAATSKALTAPLAHPATVRTARFSPDGASLFTIARGQIRIWDVGLDTRTLEEWRQLAERGSLRRRAL